MENFNEVMIYKRVVGMKGINKGEKYRKIKRNKKVIKILLCLKKNLLCFSYLFIRRFYEFVVSIAQR